MSVFERIISIDWSGGKERTEQDYVSLRVAQWDKDGSRIERPPNTRFGRRKWSRLECRAWLLDYLRADLPRTLVAADFGFGLPWGSDRAIFGVTGWARMVKKIAEVYSECLTARQTARAVNQMVDDGSHGPYRLSKKDRTDFRFYLDHNIGYFRLTELLMPQAISQWYLGAGAKVGYHSLTGIPAIHWLTEQRNAGVIQFQVWPQETFEPEGHVIVESYPSIVQEVSEDWGGVQGSDERDAWKVLNQLVAANRSGEIKKWFQIEEVRCGRVPEVGFREQVQFEGFVFGLR